MFQTAFIEAVVNRTHTVLGRTLHDFCIADVIALEFAENPLWVGGPCGMEHLQQAALICSLAHGRFLEAKLDPQNRWERLARALWKNQNRVREQRGEFPAELARWNAYVDDFYAPPEFWPGDKGTALRAPAFYSMACFIEMHSNMTEREILIAPIGRMLWKSATLAERLGIAPGEIMTEDEIEVGREQEEAANVVPTILSASQVPAPEATQAAEPEDFAHA